MFAHLFLTPFHYATHDLTSFNLAGMAIRAIHELPYFLSVLTDSMNASSCSPVVGDSDPSYGMLMHGILKSLANFLSSAVTIVPGMHPKGIALIIPAAPFSMRSTALPMLNTVSPQKSHGHTAPHFPVSLLCSVRRANSKDP